MLDTQLERSDIQKAMEIAIKQKDDLKKKLATIEKDRSTIKTSLETVEQELSTYEQALQFAELRLGINPNLKKRFIDMSRPEACAVFMHEMGGEAKVADLVPKLLAAGKLPKNSKRAWDKVRTSMEQRPDLFVKLDSGRYALAKRFKGELPKEDQYKNGRPQTKLRDHIAFILKQSGVPLHRKSILQKLREMGIEVTGKDPMSNLSAHLSNDPRFTCVSSGYWGLKTWGEKGKQEQLQLQKP
jgi:hypothetical protein